MRSTRGDLPSKTSREIGARVNQRLNWKRRTGEECHDREVFRAPEFGPTREYLVQLSHEDGKSWKRSS